LGVAGSKDVWTAHLPRWRKAAAGRLGDRLVFLVVELDRDPGRFVRLEISSAHARSLAADLQAAAMYAEHPGYTGWVL
jgi:hypothetical protein